ncbi:MAG: serine/threonine-protein kinase [Acidobacteriota bacterium]
MTASSPRRLPAAIGSYRVVRRLALGGMGEVLLGHDDGLDRPVAIKRIRPEAHLVPARRERFRREAQTVAQLDHPVIVRVYELIEAGDLECIVMEYVEGEDLRRRVREKQIPIPFAVKLGIDITDGLALAHDHGIIHRDLKTDNVLVGPDGQCKILDFGIAKQLLKSQEALTQPSALIGTCRSMAPEQAMQGVVGPRSDIFSFGVLLYEMVTGISPFEGANDLQTLKRLTMDPHRPAREVRSKVPAELSELIDDLLAKDPDHRPSSAGEVRCRLEQLADDLELFDDRGSGIHRALDAVADLPSKAWKVFRPS